MIKIGDQRIAKKDLYNESGKVKGKKLMARKGEKLRVVNVPHGFSVHGKVVVRGIDNEFATHASNLD